MQLQSKNDIRQWVGAPQHLTDEAQTIARITGYQPTSQFFLIRAANQEQLLERQAALSERLQQLVNLDKLQGYWPSINWSARRASNSKCANH